MSTEMVLAPRDQMEFARMFADARTGPYRGDPGSALIAISLGLSMGLSPGEAVSRIHVVEGKPSASAELIRSQVIKAGHRFRSWDNEDGSVTCEIVRADDPEFPYTATWSMEDARRAELVVEKNGRVIKDNWRKYPKDMLLARATTQVARRACPEALFGVAYSPEERQNAMSAPPPKGDVNLGKLRAALQPEPPVEVEVEAVVIRDEPARAESAPETGEQWTDSQRRRVWKMLRDIGFSDWDSQQDEIRAECGQLIGRDIDSMNAITKEEASVLIERLGAALPPEYDDEAWKAGK